jgi:hypothetical protein
MRILKLSPEDEEMETRESVIQYFTETLWTRSRHGRFGLTEAKARMEGIATDTLLLFTYRTECMFLARAAGEIVNDRQGSYLPVQMGSMVPVSGPLAAFEAALLERGLSDKNLVHAQAWPSLTNDCARFAERYFNYASRLRFVFVRVGWMQHYRGPTAGDERPIGGGGYNKEEIGHEVYNFQPLDGRLYGYYQPQMRADRTHLERIDPIGVTEDELEDVTVIWVARRPHIGQQIIGWYRHSKLYRKLGPVVKGRPQGFENYRCTTSKKNGVLLPVAAREFSIPRGQGGFGQANVCYPLNADGSRKEEQWMLNALCFIEEYDGGNVVAEPTDEALEAVIQELEAANEGRSGQGFSSSVQERIAIEQRGMDVATKFYESQGYDVQNVSKRKPYDLLCTKKGKELRVEVKATTNTGDKVFLTRREALHATKTGIDRALFILHSVQVKEGIASKGIPVVHEPWTLSWDDATPLVYSYIPPKSC